MLEAGRTLVGAKGFGCTKCHDMLGVASQGTRGPELSFVPRRVNFDWYLRWMTDPQRIQPGTRMPTVFLSGQSPHKEILGGDPQQQRLAVWQYLQRSRSLPPPDGLQSPTITDLPDDRAPRAGAHVSPRRDAAEHGHPLSQRRAPGLRRPGLPPGVCLSTATS